MLNVKSQPAALPQFESAAPLVGREAEWALLQKSLARSDRRRAPGPDRRGSGTPAQRADLFGILDRQVNQSNRFAPSDAALAYARAALEALPPSVSPELRAPHQFHLGYNLLWHGDPESRIALEVELQSLADYERFWNGWTAQVPPEWWERWNKVIESGGSNEIWTLVE